MSNCMMDDCSNDEGGGAHAPPAFTPLPQASTCAMAARLAAAPLALVVVAVAMAHSAGAPLGGWSAGSVVAWGGPQDGQDPNQPSGGLVSGSCGFGEQSRGEWPFWNVVALSPAHPLAADAARRPLGGCGACLQIECVGNQPGFQVRRADGVVYSVVYRNSVHGGALGWE